MAPKPYRIATSADEVGQLRVIHFKLASNI